MTKFTSISFTMADVIKLMVFIVSLGSAYLGLVIEIRDGKEAHNLLAYRVTVLEKKAGISVLNFEQGNDNPKRIAVNLPVKNWIIQDNKIELESDL